MKGRSGLSARARWARTSSSSISARRSSSPSAAIFITSCEVRKPSKKWMKGTRDASVAAWAISARSCASWTEPDDSSAQPVCRVAITSEWSPKIESPWAAIARAATWKTVAVNSPAIL
jgi:hypothetical protein